MIELFNVNGHVVVKKTVAVVPGTNNVVFTGVKQTLLIYKADVGKSTSKEK